MSKADTARSHHESARQEQILRIQLRDNILIAFLGAVGTVFGIALTTGAKPELLLIVPYLALGATVLVVHHHGAIRSIAYFLSEELEPFLCEIDEDAPQWENSRALNKFLARSLFLRTTAHYLLIIAPSIGSLAMNSQHIFQSPLSLQLLWWFGAVVSLLSIALATANHVSRLAKVELRSNRDLQHRRILVVEEGTNKKGEKGSSLHH